MNLLPVDVSPYAMAKQSAISNRLADAPKRPPVSQIGERNSHFSAAVVIEPVSAANSRKLGLVVTFPA